MRERKGGMMAKLSEKELRKLIKGGETNTVELKVAPPRATEMAERLCGMANAQGGVMIIGVKDADHEIVGVPEHRIGEALDVLLRAARQMIKPELVLDPPEPEIYSISGKQLVVATVKPSQGPVYQAHGIYWVRRGTHTVSLGLPELLEMANDRGCWTGNASLSVTRPWRALILRRSRLIWRGARRTAAIAAVSRISNGC